jgi:phosphatidylserine decarboxylase
MRRKALFSSLLLLTAQSLNVSISLAGTMSNGAVRATSSTMARPVSAFAADAHNVLSYGADPTGSTDSTTALTNALAPDASGIFHNVYLSPGIYHITKSLTVSGNRNRSGNLTGQCLFGDNATSAIISVSYDYSPDAGSPIVLLGNAFGTPCLENVHIYFDQPKAGSRANFATLSAGCGKNGKGCRYPPAIDLTKGYNTHIESVVIGGAWDCIHADWTNTSEGLNELIGVKCGALDRGLDMAGSTGIVDITNYHFFPWDIGPNSAIYFDGGTYAAYFSSMQGIMANNFFSQNGRVAIVGTAQPTSANFSNLQMDQDGATFEVDTTGYITVTGGHSIGSATGADLACEMQISQGTLLVSSHIFRNNTDSTVPLLCLSGGELDVIGSNIAVDGTGVSAIRQSGGNLVFSGNEIATQTPSAWKAALVSISGGSYTITDNYVGALGGSGMAINSSSDATFDTVTNNTFGSNWAFTPPGPQGSYVGTTWALWTPIPTCGSGSLSSYTSQGWYQRVGKQMQIHTTIALNSVGTCSASLALSTPLPANRSIQANGSGRDNTTGYSLMPFIQGSAIWVQKYDGSSPIAAGHTLSISATYVLP